MLVENINHTFPQDLSVYPDNLYQFYINKWILSKVFNKIFKYWKD